MRRVDCTILSLALAFTALTGASAQSGSDQALLRMERIRPGQAVCVLVEASGEYRLEKLFRAKSEMYKGSMDAARVDTLRAILATDQLRTLSQENIHGSLMTDTLDTIQLAIWRNHGWQQLLFPAPDSRKPFRESMDPVVRWFEDVVKQRPQASRVEGVPTHCSPPPVTQVLGSSDPSAQRDAAPAASAPPQYLFRLYSNHFYAGNVDTTCTIVFGDGSYRLGTQ